MLLRVAFFFDRGDNHVGEHEYQDAQFLTSYCHVFLSFLLALARLHEGIEGNANHVGRSHEYSLVSLSLEFDLEVVMEWNMPEPVNVEHG